MKKASEIYREVHARHRVSGRNADKFDLEAMEEYAGQYKSQWIPVKEKFPEIGKDVIIHCIDRDFVNDNPVITGYVYRISDDIHWWCSIHAHEDEDLTITHWMPLPEKPQI